MRRNLEDPDEGSRGWWEALSREPGRVRDVGNHPELNLPRSRQRTGAWGLGGQSQDEPWEPSWRTRDHRAAMRGCWRIRTSCRRPVRRPPTARSTESQTVHVASWLTGPLSSAPSSRAGSVPRTRCFWPDGRFHAQVTEVRTQSQLPGSQHGLGLWTTHPSQEAETAPVTLTESV